MSTENAAAVSEILKSGKEITALNDELGKYKTVFKKIMLDLQQASPIADEHQEFDTTATGDPLEIYNEFRKRSVNTGKIDLSSKQIQNIAKCTEFVPPWGFSKGFHINDYYVQFTLPKN